MALLLSPQFLILFFTLLILSIHGDATTTTTASLTRNQSLSGGQTLVSPGGKFVLGFFRPGNSSYYYLGIWFNNLPKSKLSVVWVANRESPLSDMPATELKFSGDGNLVLLESSKTPIWSTNLTTTLSTSDSITAMLRDDGNFVILDYHDYTSGDHVVLWQSFDHPTDAWMPGGKLGRNKLTGEIQILTSWKNDDDPSPGMFTLSIDPAGSSQYFLCWNSSKVYWSSGLWNGEFFDGVPEMSTHYIFDFKYVNNTNESYFTYSVQERFSSITRYVLDVSGQTKNLMWVPAGGGGGDWSLFWFLPKAQCTVYGLCGAFGSCDEHMPSCSCLRGFSPAIRNSWMLGDQTSGCRRDSEVSFSSNCSASTDRFYEMDDVGLPDNSQTLPAARKNDCDKACLNNCSCTAYSYNNNCLLWYGNLLNTQQLHDGSGHILYLRLAASELQNSKTRSKKGLIAGVSIGVMIVIFVISFGAIHKLIRSRGRRMKGNLVIYTYTDLKRVTKNFSEKIGGGGFGSVFKGVLRAPGSTSIVAVKKLEGIYQGEKQFRAEVSTLGMIQHVNLVRLRGFCSEGTNRLLVYDYMSNGSLAHQLFQNKNNVLSWKMRYQIALGTARGLAYLHEKCRDCIIHCDIKPENILLDSSFNPKMADFGLAKLVGRDFSRILTTIRGTLGYLAPEWISGIAITSKADVYSYGLVLFEIVAGKRNWGSEGKGTIYFPLHAAWKLREGEVLSLLDQRLEGEGKVEEIARVCKLACWCIQDDESVRPTMGQVVQILEGALEVEEDPPVPSSLRFHGDG